MIDEPVHNGQEHPEPRAIIEQVLLYWSRQDVLLTMELFAEDAVYVQYLAPEVSALAGETRGREAIAAALFGILAEWDPLVYEPTIVGVEGEAVRAQVKLDYRHRRSGEHLVSTMRLIFTVADGLIRNVQEFHDAAMVEALVRLSSMRDP